MAIANNPTNPYLQIRTSLYSGIKKSLKLLPSQYLGELLLGIPIDDHYAGTRNLPFLELEVYVQSPRIHVKIKSNDRIRRRRVFLTYSMII